jgi:hypothetical protein
MHSIHDAERTERPPSVVHWPHRRGISLVGAYRMQCLHMALRVHVRPHVYLINIHNASMVRSTEPRTRDRGFNRLLSY